MNPPEYILPPSDFGDPLGCGLLLPLERGAFADIICTHCRAIVQSLETADLPQ